MAIIISKNGKNAERIEEASFGLEDNLQQYISDNPDAVPIYEIDENINLLILAREFPTESGSIDAVGIDQDGNIYLVETKLYKNPDKRLVVAQVLDYGASLWKSSIDFDEFLVRLNSHSQKLFNADATEKISDHFNIESEEVTILLENIKANLNSGTFKFVVLMNKLEKRLKDLVLFLNQNSSFDVYAVELEYYKKDELEIIIPKIHGTEIKKQVTSNKGNTTARRKWDEESFIEHAKSQLDNPSALFNMLEYTKEFADKINWGTGTTMGSANAVCSEVSEKRSVYSLFSNGELQINFGWLDEGEAVAYRDKLHQSLAKADIPGLSNENMAKYWPVLAYEEWAPYVKKLQKIFTASLQ